jgi:nucleoside-diphosphate-sugar epimerase
VHQAARRAELRAAQTSSIDISDMPNMRIAVTGAFGYSGRYITRRLLNAGHEITTLTNSIRRANPFGDQVRVCGFHFDASERLRDSLRGIDCLIHIWWGGWSGM